MIEFSAKVFITKLAPKLITLSLPLSLVLATPLVGFAAAYYAVACGTVTAVSIAISVCKYEVSKYENAHNCVTVDLEQRSLVERAGVGLYKRSDNPCTDWLSLTPNTTECKTTTEVRNCTKTVEQYMVTGFSLDESTSLVENCLKLADFEDKLSAFCNFYNLVAEFEPTCGPEAISPSSTSSHLSHLPSNSSIPSSAHIKQSSSPHVVSQDKPTETGHLPSPHPHTPLVEAWPTIASPNPNAIPHSPFSSPKPDLPRPSIPECSSLPGVGTSAGNASFAMTTSTPTFLSTNTAVSVVRRNFFDIVGMGLLCFSLLVLAGW